MPLSSRRLTAGAACLSLAIAAGAPVAAAGAMPAKPAAAFLDSIGVVTHAVYYDTPYGDWDRVMAKLKLLGVRHLRDGLYANPAPNWADWNARYYRDVDAATAAGMRFTYGVGQPGRWAGTVDDQIAVLKGRLAGTADAVEGPNEPDISGNPNWAAVTRSDQQEIFRKVKADPVVSRLPVIGPSLVFAWSRAELGDLSAFMDAGNLHPYTGATAPSPAHMVAEATLASAVSGSKPLYASEAGFHNAVNDSGNQPAASERAAAIYTMRTFLEHYRAGVLRTFAYELLDEHPDPSRASAENEFGLLRNDFSEKPAFTGLANMIAALQPVSGWNGVTRPVDLTVWADAGIQRLLLQRGDGSYALVLWQNSSVWNRDTQADLYPAARAVPVTLLGLTSASAVRPLVSRSPQALGVANQTAVVPVGADPVIVTFATAPAGVTARRTAAASRRSVARRHRRSARR